MKKIFILALGMLMMVMTASATPIITVANIGASTNSPANVDVSISGVPDLYAFGFDVTFDPTLLSITGDTPGGLFTGSGQGFIALGATIDNAGGHYYSAGYTFFGATGVDATSGILLTLNFLTGNNYGYSPITLDNIILLDSNLDQISDFELVNGSVTVPEPMSLSLMASGLLGGWYSRRRKRA
jgi:hypothetical protein